MQEYLRVSKAAELFGVTPQTIRKYKREGRIKGYATPGGQIIYKRDELNKILDPGLKQHHEETKKTAHYIRSSNGNKKLLKTQQEQLETKYGEPDYLIQDKASGLNENRKGLNRLFDLAQQGEINEIIVTQQDRLTRFGYPYIKRLLESYGCRITVAFDKEDKTLQEELMQDFMSLIASFSGKFYRLRGYEQQRQLLANAGKKIDEKENA